LFPGTQSLASDNIIAHESVHGDVEGHSHYFQLADSSRLSISQNHLCRHDDAGLSVVAVLDSIVSVEIEHGHISAGTVYRPTEVMGLSRQFPFYKLIVCYQTTTVGAALEVECFAFSDPAEMKRCLISLDNTPPDLLRGLEVKQFMSIIFS
jgi:hypothetical protein